MQRTVAIIQPKIILIIWMVLVTQLLPPIAKGEPHQVSELAAYEAQANNSRGRAEWRIRPEHIEVPLTHIYEINFAKNLPEWLKEALIFQRDGQKWLRWIIHPEDKDLHIALIRSMQQQGIPVVKGQHFEGYFSASRSMFLQDPVTQKYFSVKVSTDHVNGEAQRKLWSADEARAARTISDLIASAGKQSKLKHLTFLSDGGSISVRDSRNSALSIRDLSPLEQEGKVYLPGFSITDSTLGRSIAQANGAGNPVEYWRQHYVEPVARAMAELAMNYGLAADSLHGQNVLLEMQRTERGLQPTGRVVLRDVADVFIASEIFAAAFQMDAKSFAKLHPEVADQVVQRKMPVSMTFLGTNGAARNAPDWLSARDYAEWGRAFFAAFEEQLGIKTRVGINDLQRQKIESHVNLQTGYSTGFSKLYNLRTPEWNERLQRTHPQSQCHSLQQQAL